jgi:hypothetical protein
VARTSALAEVGAHVAALHAAEIAVLDDVELDGLDGHASVFGDAI